jgi:hypothetical protein
MKHKIHESLADLAVPLNKLTPLVGNPRVGNVDAIAASYREFGQLKPVVVHANDDDTYTVIAGNHQVQAVRSLGWSHIAAVQMVDDEEHAVAFALVDNRVTELGRTDHELLHDMLGEVVTVYPELFDAVGWDDFEFAALETSVNSITEVGKGAAGGYVPPVLVARPGDEINAPNSTFSPTSALSPSIEVDGREGHDGEAKFVAPTGIDQRAAIMGGSPITGQAGTRKTSFQYTLVFDDGDQMKQWWDFLRMLRSSAAYDGETIAGKLMSFIDAHSEI